MKLSIEQANALLAAEPFVILCVSRMIDSDGDDEVFGASIGATNINNEHGMEELVLRLAEEAREGVNDIGEGSSVYLCQMKWSNSYIAYSGHETDPFWEIVSYELVGFTALEELEQE